MSRNPTAEGPQSPQDALYFPTDVSPEDLLAALERIRTEAEAEIERLIDLVDQIDAYDEREPSGDEEPSLAHTDAGVGFADGIVDGELEFATTEMEDRRPKRTYNWLWADGREPILGAPERHPSGSPVRIGHNGPVYIDVTGYTSQGDQTNWCAGESDDREGDGCADDREETCEDEGAEHDGREPSLGWTDGEAKRGRTCAGTMEGTTDLEHGEPARCRQGRTRIDRNVTVDVGYGRSVRGVPPAQKGRMRAAMQKHRSDVTLA